MSSLPIANNPFVGALDRRLLPGPKDILGAFSPSCPTGGGYVGKVEGMLARVIRLIILVVWKL
jgi:hypothetical protein